MGHRVTTLNVNTIEPAGSTLTLGASGDTIVAADSVNVNTVKDLGGGYLYASFTSTGASTWTCPTGVTSAEILVVGGGGGGGSYYHGGGGGAGGIVHATGYTVVPDVVYDITVGAKGAKGSGNAAGSDGSDSVWNVNAEGSGIAFTASGGGGGANESNPTAKTGGSGGGGTYNSVGAASDQSSFSGATSYGNTGGGDTTNRTGNPTGGGGGSGGVGGDGITNVGGFGGPGRLFSNFTDYGVSGYFAGGGGGSVASGAATAGTGGSGGGGDGSYNNGSDATASTGSGGGGGERGATTGGDGADGIVLIRYQTPTTGNTLWVSNGSGTLSSVNSGFGDALKLISSQTVTDQASVSFTSGISSTYKEYIFKFYNINPATDGADFQFQAGSSSYDTTLTSTAFMAYHAEDGSSSALTYLTAQDQAQGTAFQSLQHDIGNAADECTAGVVHLFNPSSTTYMKNWYCRSVSTQNNNTIQEEYFAGYFNVATALTQVQFKMDSGNFDGTIMMYGVA